MTAKLLDIAYYQYKWEGNAYISPNKHIDRPHFCDIVIIANQNIDYHKRI